MTWKPVPLIGGTYADDTKPLAAQECIGWIPEKAAPDGRASVAARGAPGEYLVGDLGARIRGMYVAEDKLFIVAGTTLYQVRADRSFLGLGSVPGTKRCDFTHNQTQLVVCNGHDAYVYHLLTADFAKITDSAFGGAKKLGYLGHFIIALDPLGRDWQHSNTEDAHDWLATDEYEAETAPDRIRSFITSHGQALFLGDRTSEWFANEPLSANESFQNTKVSFPRGCGATYAVASLDNTIIWPGDDGVLYKLAGVAQPVRISTHAMEQAFSRCDLSQAFAFTYEDHGHAIYYLTFPDGHTWGYDVSTGLVHRRVSPGLDRWRINALVKWDGRWYGGDYASGKVYTLDWDYAQTEADPLIRSRVPSPVYAGGNRIGQQSVKVGFAVRESRVPDVTAWWQAIVISPAMADGQTNDVVSHQYVQTGGAPGGTWSVAGSLPTGLTLDEDTGLVTGFLQAQGTFTPTIKYTEPNGHVGSLDESVVVEPIYFASQMSDVDTPFTDRINRTLYGAFNRYDFSVTTLAVHDVLSSYTAIGNPGFLLGGRLIARCEFDDDGLAGAQSSGLYSLEYDGTTTLSVRDHWQLSTAVDHDYLDHVKWDEDTVIVAVLDSEATNDCKLVALSVTAGVFAVLGSLTIDTGANPLVSLVVHGTGADKRLVAFSYNSTEGRRFCKAYTCAAGVFTQVASYGGSFAASWTMAHADTIVSLGGFLFTPTGSILTLIADTFALVDSFVPVNDVSGLSVWKQTDNDDLFHIRFLDSNTKLHVWSFDGVNAVFDQAYTGTFTRLGRCDTLQDDDVDPAIRAQQGEYFVPIPDSFVSTLNGVYLGNIGSYTRAEDLVLDYDANPDASRMTFAVIDKLTTL